MNWTPMSVPSRNHLTVASRSIFGSCGGLPSTMRSAVPTGNAFLVRRAKPPSPKVLVSA